MMQLMIWMKAGSLQLVWDEGWSSDGDEAVSFHDEDDEHFSIDIEDS